MFTIVISFCSIESFIINSFFVSQFFWCVLRSISPHIILVLYSIILFSFGYCLQGIYFFHPFTLNLFVSLDLNWMSYRWNIVAMCVFIHSDNLCLLIGKLNPFAFKVITIRNGLFCHLLFVFCLPSTSFVPPFPALLFSFMFVFCNKMFKFIYFLIQ